MFDPLTVAFDDPELSRLRREAPVVRTPSGAWFLARHAEDPSGQQTAHDRGHRDATAVVSQSGQQAGAQFVQMRQVIAGHGHQSAPVVVVTHALQLRKYFLHGPVMVTRRDCRRRGAKVSARAHDQPAIGAQPEVA